MPHYFIDIYTRFCELSMKLKKKRNQYEYSDNSNRHAQETFTRNLHRSVPGFGGGERGPALGLTPKGDLCLCR